MFSLLDFQLDDQKIGGFKVGLVASLWRCFLAQETWLGSDIS